MIPPKLLVDPTSVTDVAKPRFDIQCIPSALPLFQNRILWLAALVGQFLTVFAIAALSGPGRIDIVDGQTRYEVARSLVEHGDSVIRDKGVWFAVLPGRGGFPHTNYRFPHSGLGVVAIWLADATGAKDESRRQFFFTLLSPVACALLAVTYSVWFRGLGCSAKASISWATAGIFCTPNWFYGTSTFDDLLAATAAVAAVAVAFLGRDRRPWRSAACSGLLLGLAFNFKQPLGLFVLPVLAITYRPRVPLRRQFAPVGIVLAGLVLGILAQRAYEDYKFPPGTPNPAHSAEALYGGVWSLDPLPAMASLAASPSSGAFWYCPTLLLSVAGWCFWLRPQRVFCYAVMLTSLLFIGFLSILVFFKGDPCWGPRYLTPVFALWWVFTPAAARECRRILVGALLGAGFLVQVLALSVDPQTLFLEHGIPFNYYCADRWRGFDPGVSHLWQRPREIVAILATEDQAPEYAPGPTPTYAVTLPSGFPVVVVSSVGLFAQGTEASALGAVAALPMRTPVHAVAHAKTAARHYHVFTSLRPWWISQQFLPPAARPIDLTATLILLVGLGATGFSLMLASLWCEARPAYRV
jgi:hypothetical protein